MKIKSTLYFLILQTLFLLFPLYTESITLGSDDNWEGLVLQNLKTIPGKGGYLDLVLQQTELAVNEDSTDILLSFNQEQSFDRSGRYSIREHPEYSQRYFKSGTGSATFDRENKMILEVSGQDALFAPFTNWEDFTIDFWLYPANPKEGEKIIQWKGLARNDEEIFTQSILCHFIDRRLVWSFSNIFQLPGDAFSEYEISGDPILPRQWNHHMLRYDSKTGMLEYLINGQPSAIIYTTESGNESNKVFTPRIGEEPGNIIIGDGFTGFMDEFSIEKRFNANRSINRYDKAGFGISPIIDLEFSDSKLDMLNAISSSPGNAAVFPYYYLTNSLLEAEQLRNKFKGEETILHEPEIWTPFTEIDAQHKGRFLILSFLLYPDMKKDVSPGLSFINIDYTPSLPPMPPTNLRAVKEEEKFKLEWNPSASPSVEGYLIYYGEKPGEYIYSGSPLKSGKENYIYIEGLSPFKQYFFAIKSFTGTESYRYSEFSEELSIRP